MAAEPILECFQQKDKWFTGVVVTDGRGSPRDGLYKDTATKRCAWSASRNSARRPIVGEYAAQVLLDYPSKMIKDASRKEPVEDILAILRATQPAGRLHPQPGRQARYPCGVALRVIEALRRLDPAERPDRLLGCEVWRALDWMVDADKVTDGPDRHENLQAALLGVFDSQIAGGKRYDLASMGRRRANATYFESHGVDNTTGLSYAMDMTPLMNDANLDPAAFVSGFIQRFANDVQERIGRMS